MTAAWTHAVCGRAIEVVRARTGLVFPPNRRREAEAGVRRAMAKAKISDPGQFVKRLSADRHVLDHLIDELTVGETYFFREPHQFELIRRQILPELGRRRHPAATIQVWSAGCASGEEAYSLAILLEEEGLADRSRILATDISRAALARARIATYGAWSLRSDQDDLADRYFHYKGSRLVLAGRFRDRVSFARLNLAADNYPSLKTATIAVDLILCRDVLIYFNQATVRKVAGRLLSCLADGGWLITGPSDPPLWDYAPYDTVVTPAGVFYRRI